MPRVSNKSVIAERENPAAPFLFDEDQLPLRHDVLQSVSERRYESTGARLLDSDITAGRMVELLCLGNGIKKVARIMEVSPHSVRAARRMLEAQGKLAPLKERFVQACGEIMEEGARAVLDAIVSGKMHPNFIGSTVGIFYDKRALALGEPTSISHGITATLKAEDLSVETINSFFNLPPADAESIGDASVQDQIQGSKPIDTDFDTTDDRPTSTGQAIANPAAELPDGGGGSLSGGVVQVSMS